MIFRKSRNNHWGLISPIFRALIAARYASFLAILGRPGIGVEMGPEMGGWGKEGLPDWRRIGRDFPRSSANRGPIIGNERRLISGP